MRWYKIVLGNGMVWDATGDPNALNVEIDIPVQSVGLAGGGAFVRRRADAGDPNFIRMLADMGGMERYDRRRSWWDACRGQFADALR